MKILVTVASKHGSTREIADTICEVLRADRISLNLMNAADVETLKGYDAVILGSAVYEGNWLAEANEFVERLRPELATLPLWVFSSGPLPNRNTQPPQANDDPALLAPVLDGLNIRDHRVFVGKIDYKELSLTERMIYKAFHAPEGDFRDWDEICAWAHEISTALTS